MPIKKTKSNTVKKVSNSTKSVAKKSSALHHPLNYPLLFLVLLSILAVLISLGYFYCQQYMYMKKFSLKGNEKKHSYNINNKNGAKPMLSSNEWVWDKSDKFVLRFNTDGTFSSTTDCNGIGGNYMVSDTDGVYLFDMVSTMMYCDGSMESEYTNLLAKVSSYSIVDDSLELKVSDGSILVFKRN